MRILIVDDEPIIRKGVSKLLMNGNKSIRNVEEAKNGKDALVKIKRNQPDVVITDIRMPIMDGLELAEEIHKVYSSIEIVVLTGYADFDYAQRALRFGVVDYLLKPITQESLNEMIVKLLLKNPAKWADQLEVNTIRILEETVSELVKVILAENRVGLRETIDYWEKFCRNQGLTFIKIKQLMGHFHLLYKSKMITHQLDYARAERPIEQKQTTVSELFAVYHDYMLREIEDISQKSAPSNKRLVDDVIKEIHNHYSEQDLNIHRLAGNANISSSYLSKMFREVIHVPITQYISEYRLEQVRKRLKRGKDAKISIIAEECGFNDYPYFSRFFKKTYGISPLEYKRKFNV